MKYELRNVSIYEDNDWGEMQSFLVKYLPKFEMALKPFVLGLN
ncbi:MAG: DUF4268 domain-containing protein [Flavobacteriales bacterium]|nr:DUF4268 domain-containing protein [Flavobacteriales bacterium]